MVVRRWQLRVVDGALLAAIAWLSGATLSLLVSALLPDDPVGQRPSTPRHPRTIADALPARYRSIAARDIFDTAAPTADAARHLRLIGTATHAPEAFAVIEDTERGQQRLYRVGDRIAAATIVAGKTGVPGNRVARPFTVAAIEPARVLLDRGGTRYVVTRLPATTSRDGPAATATRPMPVPTIRQGRSDEFVLARREVQRALADLDHVATQIRAIPNFVDGEATGYRVFGIKTGSLFDRLGLRNGDVLERVNTTALTDPARALAMLQDLPRERRVTLDVSRGDRSRRLTYEVR